jgi:PAS domain S-box-containing protein
MSFSREPTEYSEGGNWPVEVPRRHHFARGALIGLALLAAFSLLKLAFSDLIGAPTPFLLYLGAVLVSAWYGGREAGFVTTAGGALCGALLFVEPRPWLAPSIAPAVTQTGLFVLEGVMITFVTSRLTVERRGALGSKERAVEVSRRLEAILRAVDEGITLQDSEGRLLYANDQAAELMGTVTPADAIARGQAGITGDLELYDQHGEPIPVDDLPGPRILRGEPAEEMLVQFQQIQQMQHDDGPASVPLGRARWSMVRAAAIRDAEGEVAFVLNVFRDVTARRLQEESIKLGQRWLSTALRTIGDAVIAVDAQGCVVLLNPIAEALTGWPSDEAASRPIGEVFRTFREDDREPVADALAEALRGGRGGARAEELGPRPTHTALLVGRDGVERMIEHSAAEIRGTAGDRVGAVLVFRDVSDRRRAEQRQAYFTRSSAILASSMDYDYTLKVVADLAVPTLADWCAVDLCAGDDLRRVAVAQVDPSRVQLPSGDQSPIRRVARTGESLLTEVVEPSMLAADEEGADLTVASFMAVPMRRGDQVFGVLTFATAESGRRYGREDLRVAEALAERAAVAVDKAEQFTEQVRARNQLEQARADAERANRMKDEFLAILGHELRNPLAPIFTALQLMKLQDSGALARERTVIERQARHLLRLVDDLLDVSRITRGTVRLAREPVNLADVVHRALQTVQPAIEERRLRVTVAVPRAVVEGDEVRLSQVVTNLLSNAAKYTDPGGLVELRAERRGDRVSLSIRDNGVGIAPEMLPRVFDLFTQEEQSLERAQGGLGLGLAIAHRLVEQHGGTLTAHSEGPGEGSCFLLTLPALDQAAPVEVDTGPIMPAGASRRILVVDDNDDARAMLVLALGAVGHEIFDAADGPQAIEVAAREEPDVALLDIGLPVMDGYELARRLREMPALGDMKLVALTGYGQDSDRARSAEVGFDAHLVKPVSLDTLQEVIEELVGL